MKARKKRRSAIVPALILSAGIMSGAAVVPLIGGCGGELHTVADMGFRGVANVGFDLGAATVAAQGFDLSSADAEDAG